jgi:hypothetical protein
MSCASIIGVHAWDGFCVAKPGSPHGGICKQQLCCLRQQATRRKSTQKPTTYSVGLWAPGLLCLPIIHCSSLITNIGLLYMCCGSLGS